MLSGDELAIQLFIAALAVSIWSVAVTQAGWTGKKFIQILFFCGALFASIALFWGLLSKQLPHLDLLANIATSAWAWLILLMMGFGLKSWFDVKSRRQWSDKILRIESELRTRVPQNSMSDSPAPRILVPEAEKWMSPDDALDVFADPQLVQNALSALNSSKAFKAKLNKLTADHTKNYSSELEATLARIDLNNPVSNQISELTKKCNDADVNYILEKQKLFQHIAAQLKNGILVARGLPFENNKLDGDWEIIKPAYWSVLIFDGSNSETVSGGGRTYRGVQIGKPRPN